MNTPVVLITGAARRLGAATARVLHQAGYAVALHCHHSRAAAEALQQELNALRADSCVVFVADLCQREELPQLVAAVVARFGGLTALVNNASSFYPTELGELTEQAWQDLSGSNLAAPLFLTQAAAPHLRQAQGGVVNIIDIHAERPLKGYVAYTAAKAGLLGLTRSLALELAPDVRVNGIGPGAILWPEDGQFPDEERAEILGRIPLQRLGSPEDIARTVRFLLLDAPYITGQMIAVDGGRSIVL